MIHSHPNIQCYVTYAVGKASLNNPRFSQSVISFYVSPCYILLLALVSARRLQHKVNEMKEITLICICNKLTSRS